MTLNDTLLADAKAVFTSTGDFAEAVTYHPRSFAGEVDRADRSINAVVVREQMAVVSQDGDTVIPVYQVHVANDATEGISSAELDLGGDAISFPPRDGKAAEQKTITQLLIQDPGLLVFECR